MLGKSEEGIGRSASGNVMPVTWHIIKGHSVRSDRMVGWACALILAFTAGLMVGGC